MILDTIAESARRRVERKKALYPMSQMKRLAYERLDREMKPAVAERTEPVEAGPAEPVEAGPAEPVEAGRAEPAVAERTEPAGSGRAISAGSARGQRNLPFRNALEKPGVSFICEVKKASPSRGLIAPDFPYVEIAREYEAAGADAISVLTEPEFFLGADRYLEEIREAVRLPLLRKDFIVDEYQIYEAKSMGASAVLLICALLDRERLRMYMGICRELGLSALAEAHSDEEISMAAEAGADIIGINNRNLKTFEVDFSNALRLRRLVDRNTLFVAESGIRTPEDIELLAENQVNAVLIGETLMRAPDKKKAFSRLKSGAKRHGAQRYQR